MLLTAPAPKTGTIHPHHHRVVLGRTQHAPIVHPGKREKAQPRFMVCPATHFEIVYSINEHMNDGQKLWHFDPTVCRAVAMDQQNAFFGAVETAGGHLTRVQAIKGKPDQVYTADTAIAFTTKSGEKVAIISKFKHPERQGEEKIIKAQYERLGFRVIECPHNLEGTGDAHYDAHNNTLWIGHGCRTSPEAVEFIKQQIGHSVNVVGLELSAATQATEHQDFFHLDTCFAPLPKGHCLIYKAGLTAEALQKIKTRIPESKWIEVSKEEAMGFACNFVQVNDTIIMAGGTMDPRLQDVIARYNTAQLDPANHINYQAKQLAPEKVAEIQSKCGVKVEFVDLSMFTYGGGAAHCLTQPEHIHYHVPQINMPAHILVQLAGRAAQVITI